MIGARSRRPHFALVRQPKEPLLVPKATTAPGSYLGVDTEAARGLPARLASLIAGQDAQGLTAAADRLGVAEVDLRDLLEWRSPFVAGSGVAATCAAAVKHFGIDPCWLVHGRYDAALHRDVLEHPRSEEDLASLIGRLMREAEAQQTTGRSPAPLRDAVWGVVAPRDRASDQ